MWIGLPRLQIVRFRRHASLLSHTVVDFLFFHLCDWPPRYIDVPSVPAASGLFATITAATMGLQPTLWPLTAVLLSWYRELPVSAFKEFSLYMVLVLLACFNELKKYRQLWDIQKAVHKCRIKNVHTAAVTNFKQKYEQEPSSWKSLHRSARLYYIQITTTWIKII